MSDTEKDKPIPNPGSKEAYEMGCTCGIMDNGHGSPTLGRIRGFWYSEDCPLHNPKKGTHDE